MLTLKIGKIIWLKTSFPFQNTKLRVKWWGQEGKGRIMATLNCAEDLRIYQNEMKY